MTPQHETPQPTTTRAARAFGGKTFKAELESLKPQRSERLRKITRFESSLSNLAT